MLLGLVGKPSVGKSTFLKASTMANIEIASYPFTTIDPNKATAYIKTECPEKQFNTKCNPNEGYCIKGNRFTPVKILDVAGLVPKAHKGKGLGNQFLDDLRQANALIHVIDGSGETNKKGEPVKEGEHSPIEDVKFLENELNMWFFSILNDSWDKLARKADHQNIEKEEAIKKQLSGLGNVKIGQISETIRELNLDKPLKKWNERERKKASEKLREKTKPTIIAFNKIDKENAKENYDKIKKEYPDKKIIPCSAESELALREASKDELIEYIPGENNFKIKNKSELEEDQLQGLEFIRKNILEEYGSTGIQEIINQASLNLLNKIPVYPVKSNLKDSDGNILPDCLLINEDDSVIDLAYKIHTDIGENFIQARDVKEDRPIGKEQKLEKNKIIEIKANT